MYNNPLFHWTFSYSLHHPNLPPTATYETILSCIHFTNLHTTFSHNDISNIIPRYLWCQMNQIHPYISINKRRHRFKVNQGPKLSTIPGYASIFHYWSWSGIMEPSPQWLSLGDQSTTTNTCPFTGHKHLGITTVPQASTTPFTQHIQIRFFNFPTVIPLLLGRDIETNNHVNNTTYTPRPCGNT